MMTIILHGELGELIGKEWHLAVSSVSEALRAIEINTGKLFRYLRSTQNGEAPYRLLLDDKDWVCAEQLVHPIKAYKTVHIIPVVGGAASGGLWSTIIGVFLVALALVLAIPSGGSTLGGIPLAEGAGLWATATSGYYGLIMTVGVALTLGGIASLLTPMPKTAQDDTPANRPSYLFGGAINSYAQGNPVPVGYGGPLLIGSQVISAGMRASDLPVLEKWDISKEYVIGAEVEFNQKYYSSKGNGSGGPTPAGKYPDANPQYWRDVTDE